MKYSLLILVVFISLIACKKSESLFPQSFTSGYYFYCKVDGIDWYPSKDNDPFAEDITATVLGDSVLGIAAYRDNEVISIYCFDKRFVVGKQYSLSEHKDYNSNADYDNDLSTSQFETDSLRKGTLTITLLDTTHKLVEGKFSFCAFHPVTKKTVEVTDGTFSINYKIH